jgi:hypothetical protein
MIILTPEDKIARGAARHGWRRSPSPYGTWYFDRAGTAYEVEFWGSGRVKEIYLLGNQVTTVDHYLSGGYGALLARFRS